MNLSRIIAAAALAGLGVVYSEWTGDAGRLTAADAMLAVANTKLTAANKDLAGAKETSQANLNAFNAERAARVKEAQVAAKAQAAERKRAADLKTALKRIHNAPKSDDGAIAPVLRRELDDLRLNGVRPVGDGPSVAPANPTNENPISPDDGSG